LTTNFDCFSQLVTISRTCRYNAGRSISPIAYIAKVINAYNVSTYTFRNLSRITVLYALSLDLSVRPANSIHVHA